MKAYDLALFLLLVNACFVLFGSLGISAFNTDDGAGGIYSSPTDVGYVDNIDAPTLDAPTQADDLPVTIFGIGVDIFAWGVLIGGVVLGGIGGLSLKATTPQVAGIVAFAFIFWGAYVSTQGILATIGLPGVLILILAGMHWWVFIAAIVQMATGTSFDNLA